MTETRYSINLLLLRYQSVQEAGIVIDAIFKKEFTDPLEVSLQGGSQSSEVKVSSAPGASRDSMSFLKDSLVCRS